MQNWPRTEVAVDCWRAGAFFPGLISSTGLHLNASIIPPPANAVSGNSSMFNVAVTFDRQRITSCSCTCRQATTSASWCSHVVAVCLQRIQQVRSLHQRQYQFQHWKCQKWTKKFPRKIDSFAGEFFPVISRRKRDGKNVFQLQFWFKNFLFFKLENYEKKSRTYDCIIPLCWVTFGIHSGIIPVG